MTKKFESMMSKVMSTLGKKGRGKSKVRGDSAYYKKMVEAREAIKKAKALNKGQNIS